MIRILIGLLKKVFVGIVRFILHYIVPVIIMIPTTVTALLLTPEVIRWDSGKMAENIAKSVIWVGLIVLGLCLSYKWIYTLRKHKIIR